MRVLLLAFEGLKGELAVEESEEKEHDLAREARRKERKDTAVAERQLRRDEARNAMEEEGMYINGRNTSSCFQVLAQPLPPPGRQTGR